jgi:transcriptional regulator with XRE-family HTH domain
MDTKAKQSGQHSALNLRIAEVAQARGYTKIRLAREAKLSYATVRALWNKPQSDPRISTLDQVAQVLGVTLDDLVERPTLNINQ